VPERILECGHEKANHIMSYKVKGDVIDLRLCPDCWVVWLVGFLDQYNQLSKDEKRKVHGIGKAWREDA